MNRFGLTRFEGEPVRRARLRKHATGDRDRRCDDSNRSYTCPRCRQVCCWCFGAADDLPAVCDDCWAHAHETKETT